MASKKVSALSLERDVIQKERIRIDYHMEIQLLLKHIQNEKANSNNRDKTITDLEFDVQENINDMNY